jgi:hypothetical protein
MKGKIDKEGTLCIKRNGVMIHQMCPIVANNKVFEFQTYCADHCPLFGEPRYADKVIYLQICQNRMLEFTDFTDERGE